MQENISQSNKPDSGSERRRFTRVPIFKKATLRGGALEGKPCIIRDFCPGGFFLSWANDTVGSEILAIKESLPGEGFTVEFDVKHKNSEYKKYTIKIEVIRVFQGGMGVSTSDPEESVLSVLGRIATAIRNKKEKESEKAKELDHSRNEKTTYSKDSERSLENRLKEILSSYVKKLDNRLIVLFKETLDENEKFEFFNAHEIFDGDHELHVSNILEAVLTRLSGNDPLKWEKDSHEEVDGNSLSLVDEKEFETYLLLTGLVSDAEAHNRILLFRVANKISEQFKPDFDENTNPVGFSQLFRTIEVYLQYKHFGYTALKVAYQQMETFLVPELITLYEEISEGNNDLPEVQQSHRSANTNRSSPSVEYNAGSNLESSVQLPHAIGGAVGGLAQTLSALRQSDGMSNMFQNMVQGNNPAAGKLDRTGTMSPGNYLPAISGFENQQQDILKIIDQIQHQDIHDWKNGDTIANINGRLTSFLSDGDIQVGDETQSVLNRAGSVLDYLNDDQHLSVQTRQDFKRMQSVLFKQAISQEGLLGEQSNPLRNIINLLEGLDKKGVNNQPDKRKILDDLISKILLLENHNADDLSKITDDLNSLLDDQIDTYEGRVQKVIEQCDHEQMMLEELRKKDNSIQNDYQIRRPKPPGEYKLWEDRVRSMIKGNTLVIEHQDGNKESLILAWIGPDSNQFVFVDDEGNKAANMTEQELVVGLVKGTAEITDGNQKPVYDRAIISSLLNEYDDVKRNIINDPDTGFLRAETFRSDLKSVLKNAIDDHAEHVLFAVQIDFENDSDNEKSISYIKHISALIRNVFGDKKLSGRLSDNLLLVVSEYLSREEAVIIAETFLKTLDEQVCQYKDSTISYPAFVGISVINNQVGDVDEVISQVIRASEQAQESGNSQTFLSENISENSDSEYESHDWEFWLEDHSTTEETMPLFGQNIFLNNSDKKKPIFYIYSGIDDKSGIIRTPARFIHTTSKISLVVPYEKQFFENCLIWMVNNKKQFSKISRYLISLSGKIINSKGSLDYVIQQLAEKSVPPGKICFEVPGNPPENEKQNTKHFIKTLSEFGCQFSLGQFGSNGLDQDAMKLPADYICIDESLTNNLIENVQSYGLIKSINDIAHMMDKKTIVPHRVNKETLQLLNEINVDYISTIEGENVARLNLVFEQDT